MKVLIIADIGNQQKIENYLSSYKKFFRYSELIEFSYFEKKGTDLSEFDCIVLDEYSLNEVVHLYKENCRYDNLFLWFEGALICISDTDLLKSMSDKAIKTKNWYLVKRINRIKIDLNRIMKRTDIDTYPSQLQLESTSFCNAQCIMCSHYYAGNKGALDMNYKILEKLSEIFPYLDVLIMHGNGEPFISKLFSESAKMYSTYGIGLTTNTNLSILTDDHVRLINQSFVNIRVSCDGCTREIYEGIRKRLSFDNFVENAIRLRDLCPSVSKTMASVLMRQNIEQLPEMVAFAAEYGFEEIIFSNLGVNLIVDNEKDNIFNYPYLASKQLKKAIDMGAKCGIKVTIPSSFDLSLDDEFRCREELEIIHSTLFFMQEEEVAEVREFVESIVGDEYRIVENLSDCYWEENLYSCDGICEWCIEKPYIDLKGDVFVCCINASYRIGNIFDYDSFLDLWNNSTYKKIRTLFYNGKLPGFCDNCQFILNKSLKKLSVPSPNEGFYQRRHISRFYHDYCGVNGDE